MRAETAAKSRSSDFCSSEVTGLTEISGSGFEVDKMGVTKALCVSRSPSSPVIPVQTAILHGFREVLRRNRWRFVQVRDGAGDFQDAVMRAR